MILNRVKFCCDGVVMRNNRGFTLIELMVTIAVFAVIVMMATPSFNKLIVNQKLNSSTRGLINAFNLAKSQAAILKRAVAVCPNKTIAGASYTKLDCATSAIPNFATITNAIEKQDVLDNRVILVQIDPKVELKSGSVTNVVFNEVGSSGASKNIILCAGNNSRTITVLQLGNVTQTTGTC